MWGLQVYTSKAECKQISTKIMILTLKLMLVSFNLIMGSKCKLTKQAMLELFYFGGFVVNKPSLKCPARCIVATDSHDTA